MSEDRRSEAKEILARFTRSYDEKREALDREVERLQDERDAAILAAYAAGMTTREIATVFGSISHQRVAQIVQQR